MRRPSSNNMALADKRRAAAEARERAAAALARVRFISNYLFSNFIFFVNYDS